MRGGFDLEVKFEGGEKANGIIDGERQWKGKPTALRVLASLFISSKYLKRKMIIIFSQGISKKYVQLLLPQAQA